MFIHAVLHQQEHLFLAYVAVIVKVIDIETKSRHLVLGTFHKDVESYDPLLLSDVIICDFVEVFEDSVHDDFLCYAKMFMKELSKFFSIHLCFEVVGFLGLHQF